MIISTYAAIRPALALRLRFALLAPLALLACNSREKAPATPAAPAATLSAKTATGDSAMVSSASPFATEAGLAVLRRGGNAIDAAVAVAMTLAVTYPTAGNLGGGGFMVAHLNGTNIALDFREVAPKRASRDMYLDANGKLTDRSVNGALAAGVPGSVAGLFEAHRKYGSLPWRDLLQPAIALADSGFAVDSAFAEDGEGTAKRLSLDSTSTALFLKDGKALNVGSRWRAPGLAATLKRIADRGRDGFYKGETASLIEAAMKAGGGIITAQDLAMYQPVWRTPIEFDYRGHHIVSMPPVSSGGLTLGLILGIVEGVDLTTLGWRTPQSIHMLAESERRAFARRNGLLGDPALVKIPVASFLNKDTAAALRAEIEAKKVASVAGAATPDKRHTTHFSVVDAKGNAVALTTTINDSYGSGFTVPGAQFLLNNEMDDFTTAAGAVNQMGLVQGESNAIAPGKRMLSSMTPTIVLDSTGAPEIVTGAAGGAYIITAVAHLIVSVLDYHRSLGDAMAAPQFHHQDVPDSLIVERGAWGDSASAMMAPLGHAVKVSPWGQLAWVHSIMRSAGAKGWEGVSEPRGHGLAKGY